ncbi:DNA-binding GntR family transcriptional regulator [Mycobacterium frederiksbergense]|uniref:DNA-binding GntR family transcriptional regulator n=1 Tax=Mycolicibacterium frederiksbergense TaxID=117567 RepID=A0ABT6KZD6_9MYCO|nr:GntR family transcriptional regulator [Mycolicibacterium frederiksbergense]MDH6196049.1 DNA-binding GntR family transcriptional regulator [Mycolicibacterium frederiksbergense]
MPQSVPELHTGGAEVLHDQISEFIRSKITAGAWPANYKLRAEVDLADEFGVARGTVRRAIRTLVAEGMLVQKHGKGTFVTAAAVEQDLINPLRSMAEDLRSQGVSYTTELLSFERARAPEPLRDILGGAQGSDVWAMRRRRRNAAGEPIMYMLNWVSYSLCPQLPRDLLVDRGLFDVLESVCGLPIMMGRRSVEPASAPEDVARALDISPASPVLYLQQTTYTVDDQPLEYSEVWTPPERIRISSVLRRSDTARPGSSLQPLADHALWA